MFKTSGRLLFSLLISNNYYTTNFIKTSVKDIFKWLLFSLFSKLYKTSADGCVCAVAQKYHKMSFIYKYSHFWQSFCKQPAFFFSQVENVSNHMEQQPHRPWEQTK